MTRSKALIQLTLALILAAAAGFMVFNWMAGQRKAVTTSVAAPQLQAIVVAKIDLTRGLSLTQDMLTTAQYPLDIIPAGAFPESEELVGRTLSAYIAAGEPITPVRLAGDSPIGIGVAAMIAPGNRAMAVKGNKVLGLAGFIRPGDRVDVLVTLLTGEQDSDPMTKTVLENIKVLATGTEFETTPDGEPSSVDSYTLEVSPHDSELLALAANQGTLNFALRSELDEETVLTKGADVETTLAAYRAVKVPKKRAKIAKKTKVEIITGAERTEQSF